MRRKTRASQTTHSHSSVSAAIPPAESFAGLAAATPWARHAFVLRVPGIDTVVERADAMARLKETHLAMVGALGFGADKFWTAEQVHGGEVAIVPDEGGGGHCVAAVDGLISASPGWMLGIHVADCAPVFVADTRHRAIAVLHSGKKGTEQNILTNCLKRMTREYATQPADIVLQLGPCIRPPEYEIDFAARVVEQARAAGVPRAQIHDCGACTAQRVDRYYSYRKEKGKTGRMLALFGIC